MERLNLSILLCLVISFLPISCKKQNYKYTTVSFSEGYRYTPTAAVSYSGQVLFTAFESTCSENKNDNQALTFQVDPPRLFFLNRSNHEVVKLDMPYHRLGHVSAMSLNKQRMLALFLHVQPVLIEISVSDYSYTEKKLKLPPSYGLAPRGVILDIDEGCFIGLVKTGADLDVNRVEMFELMEDGSLRQASQGYELNEDNDIQWKEGSISKESLKRANTIFSFKEINARTDDQQFYMNPGDKDDVGKIYLVHGEGCVSQLIFE